MKIHLINPNSTASMTEQVLKSALMVCHPDTQITASNPGGIPASIECCADEAMAVPAMLDEIRKGETEGINAYVVACFDDPGLHAAREVARGPIVGICQAAIQIAMTVSRRFSIITKLPRSVALVEDLVNEYGAQRHCRNVRAIDLPALCEEDDLIETEKIVLQEIEKAKHEDRAEAVILGCAGMSSLCVRLRDASGVPVIDGVTAAVKIAEALVGAGFLTSKYCSYDYPRIST